MQRESERRKGGRVGLKSAEDRCEYSENRCGGHEFRYAAPEVAESIPKPALRSVSGFIFGPECGPIFGTGIRTHFWVRIPAPNINSYEHQKGGSIFGAGFRPQKRGRLCALSGPKTGPLARPFARCWRRAHGRIMRRNGPPLGRRSCAWMRPKHPFAFIQQRDSKGAVFMNK